MYQVAHAVLGRLQLTGIKHHELKGKIRIHSKSGKEEVHLYKTDNGRLRCGGRNRVRGITAKTPVPNYIAILCKADNQFLFLSPMLMHFYLAFVQKVNPLYRLSFRKYGFS